jgi:hypothetical protein
MARFSQRVGAKPPFSSGLNEASPNLRTAAWNMLHDLLMPLGTGQDWARYQASAKAIWNHVHWTIDKIPHYASDGRREFKEYWFKCDWSDFFDVFELGVYLLAREQRERHRDPERVFVMANNLLEQQGCAYRFISEQLAPITNKLEMAEVKLATECAIEAASTHFLEALNQLPPNPKASTRNSVKESMLAVEATLKHLSDSPSATLGEGLKAFEAKYGPLHETMRKGFDKLYAYSNGPDGIRHALVDGAREVTVDDARLMIIQCSAFSNYLIAIGEAAKTKGTGE